MECKNCKNELNIEDKFCNNCGAKVINHRLTINYFFSEIVENMFSIDTNKPVRTIIDLIVKPADVIGGYINGVRKKYLNPFAFFTIAITLSGIYYFLLNNYFPDLLDTSASLGQTATVSEKEASKDTFDFVFKYQTIIFFLTVPIMAFISKLVFLKNKKYNYVEHLIINLYAYSTTSIVMVILYLLTLWNSTLYLVASGIGIIFLFSYYLYVLQQLYKLSAAQTILKLLLFGFIFFVLIIIVMVILFNSGVMDEFIEQIKREAELRKATAYIASSVINWTS